MPEMAGAQASPWLSALGRLLDPLMLVLTLLLAAWLWGGGPGPAVLVLALLAFLLALPGQGSLGWPLPVPHLLLHLLLRWCWMAGALGALGWLTGYLAVFDARMLGHWLWMVPMAQISARLLLLRVTPGLARLHGPPRPAVIVGLNAQGTLLAKRLLRSPLEGIELLGFFDDRLAERGAGVAAGLLERRYGIAAQDPNAWLEAAASRHTSGDEGRMAQRLLDDFRRAQLGPIALELPPSP